VFRAELPKALPPKRPVAYKIDTRDARAININLYLLSAEKLTEQGRQVEDLLSRGLIRPSSSP
jgi:hypothetical protein